MNYRLPAAIYLSLLFFFWAALRPEDVAHDTDLYLEVFGNYFSDNGEKFSELVFGWIASGLAIFFNEIPNGREIGGRFFLIVIALLESVLFFLILKRKTVIEASLIAFGFGPLIFLDIIRQGLAMLLAGVFFLEERPKKLYLMLIGTALATHIVAVIAVLRFQATQQQPAQAGGLKIGELNPRLKKIRLKPVVLTTSYRTCVRAKAALWKNKNHLKILLGFLLMILIGVYFGQDDLQKKIDFYFRTGYLVDMKELALSMESFSVANVLVILFFLFACVVGGFTKFETFVLVVLYLFSIIFPLTFRVYFFYFFLMSCSRDMLMSHKRIPHIIFNIGYAFILLRFFLNAFKMFDK